MAIAVIMLLCAGSLQIYNNFENNRVEKETVEVVSKIEEIYIKQIKQEQEENNQQNEPEEPKKTVEIDGYNYIGLLSIPSLDNLTLPVINECSDKNLKKSICRYNGTAEKGNLVIGGHNYRYSFGKLSKLNEGSIVYFKNMEGTIYKYKCTEILTLSPQDVYELQTGNWDLTLFTCTYDNRNRLTLRFEQI